MTQQKIELIITENAQLHTKVSVLEEALENVQRQLTLKSRCSEEQQSRHLSLWQMVFRFLFLTRIKPEQKMKIQSL